MKWPDAYGCNWLNYYSFLSAFKCAHGFGLHRVHMHYILWKSMEKIFWFVCMEKENNFPDLIFWDTFS